MSILRIYIEANRKEQPNLCEILDLLLDKIEKLESKVADLDAAAKRPEPTWSDK